MALMDKTSKSRWFLIGHDKGKDVHLEVRPVPAILDRQLRREVFGEIKARKAGNQPVARQLERYEDYAAARAVYAAVNSKNFFLGLGDEAAVAQYGPLLGVEAKAGGEVCLDGKWTEELKKQLVQDFPRFAAKASDLADSILQADLEEETEATDDF